MSKVVDGLLCWSHGDGRSQWSGWNGACVGAIMQGGAVASDGMLLTHECLFEINAVVLFHHRGGL